MKGFNICLCQTLYMALGKEIIHETDLSPDLLLFTSVDVCVIQSSWNI